MEIGDRVIIYKVAYVFVTYHPLVKRNIPADQYERYCMAKPLNYPPEYEEKDKVLPYRFGTIINIFSYQGKYRFVNACVVELSNKNLYIVEDKYLVKILECNILP